LIISFGYGRNKEGDFEMRFGPINQTGGEKRLNVLFSRAKKEIHFFSSVKFSDFPQTKNESVILLKQWFALMEENNLKKSKSYEIHVLDILEQANDADDFTQLISIYNERGWKILPF
jgi:superfamily I DNA and/or RNA helicase